MTKERYLADTRREGRLPESFEIDCIITTKVYDACRQQECEFFEFFVPVPEDWEDDEVEVFAEIIPSTVSHEIIDIELINGGPLARIQIEVCSSIKIILVNEDTSETEEIVEEVCFEKDVVLYMPDPDKMEAIAEAIFQVVGDPIVELIDNEDDQFSIIIPIGAFIILKSVAQVQLLVPTFGFCPTPPVCEEVPDLDVCEEFQQLPFPDFYPPQPNKNVQKD